MSDETSQSENSALSYLVFRLGDELFGTELLKVLEVMKLPKIKPVPYMKPAFKGVLNLRGQIVSVVDLRTHFEIPTSTSDSAMVLIVETAHAPIGAIVDELVSVDLLSEEEIDRQPVIETKISSQHLLGIAKKNKRLITIIDISGCLTSADLRAVRQREKVA